MKAWCGLVVALLAGALALEARGGTQATLRVHRTASPVTPLGVRLEGPDTREARFPDNGPAIFAQLPAGEWTVVPIYAGEVPGQSQQIVITDQQQRDVTMPVEPVGAFRLLAASGMCEPPDTWMFSGPTPRPQRQDAGIARVPGSRTCLRDVGGLWPGTYTITVIPPADVLPPYRVNITVAAQTQTDVTLTWPEVIVTGQVTPFVPALAGVPVEFVPNAVSSGSSSVTFSAPRVTPQGRYVAALPRAGVYQPQVRVAPALDWVHPTEVEFQAGVTEFPIRLNGHVLEVQFVEAGGAPSHAATGTINLEHRDGTKVSRRITDLSKPAEVPGLRAGHYQLAVVAQGMGGRLTARVTQEFEFTAEEPRQVVVVELIARAGSIEVVNADGAPLPGAHVYARPPSLSTITDDKGLLDLSVFPTGTDLTIRTSQWATTCHRVTALSAQRIVVPDATDELTLVVPPEPTPDARPLRGRESAALSTIRISGLPGATCPVAWSDLPVMRAKDPSGRAYIVTLPRGTYTLTLLNGRQFTVQVPGRLELPR